MVVPLLANKELTHMLSQHYWQEFFDGDSFVSHSRFDAYAKLLKICHSNVLSSKNNIVLRRGLFIAPKR